MITSELKTYTQVFQARDKEVIKALFFKGVRGSADWKRRTKTDTEQMARKQSDGCMEKRLHKVAAQQYKMKEQM